jgi:hypothetical protein
VEITRIIPPDASAAGFTTVLRARARSCAAGALCVTEIRVIGLGKRRVYNAARRGKSPRRAPCRDWVNAEEELGCHHQARRRRNICFRR